MEKNFFDKRISRWYVKYPSKNDFLTIGICMIFATAFALQEDDLKWKLILSVIFNGIFIIIFFVSDSDRKDNRRRYDRYTRKQMKEYQIDLLAQFGGINGLRLSNIKEDKEEVYDYINNAIANNEIIFRHRAFPRRVKSDINSETILLPKYLLDCSKRVVVAIPIEDVYWVIAEQNVFVKPLKKEEANAQIPESGQIDPIRLESWTSPVVSIYCKESKTRGILCKNIKEAERIASELNVYFPNYIGESTKELRKMTVRNYAEFSKMCEQKKADYYNKGKK